MHTKHRDEVWVRSPRERHTRKLYCYLLSRQARTKQYDRWVIYSGKRVIHTLGKWTQWSTCNGNRMGVYSHES